MTYNTPHSELNTVFMYMYLKSKETGGWQYSIQGIGTLKFELEESKCQYQQAK